MDAIDAVPNAAAVANMRGNFTSFIGRMISALNQHIQNEGLSEPLLPLPGDVYERFVFKNAHDFIKTHFARNLPPALRFNKRRTGSFFLFFNLSYYTQSCDLRPFQPPKKRFGKRAI